MDADRFRVDVHDPAKRCSTSTLETATAFANVIPFGPDLRDPLHRFLVIAEEDGFTFGAVAAEADGSYRNHDKKPWTHVVIVGLTICPGVGQLGSRRKICP